MCGWGHPTHGGGGDRESQREPKRQKDTQVTVGKKTAGIKNKIARSELYGKLRHEKALDKKKKRVVRQKEAGPCSSVP